MKLNENKLVMQSVIGEIHSPQINNPYRVTPDGRVTVLPSVGGIVYNVRIGDSACGFQADHIEPCVTIKNSNDSFNGALNTLACIGNEAKIISGDAKGEKGFVTGKHGGCEHVLIDFKPEILDKLAIGDKIQIKSFGVGLEFSDFNGVKIFNIDPALLKKIKIKLVDEKVEFPVTHTVPAKIMGSGIGKDNVNRGDYDIQLFDEEITKKYDLKTLCLGDFVAITDADNSYGRIYKKGAISIGVVVHTDCVNAGHGPGVVTVMSSAKGLITPVIEPKSNLIHYLYKK